MDKARLAPIPTSKVRKRVLKSKKLRQKALLEQSQALSNIIQARQWLKEILMHSLQQRQGLFCQTSLYTRISSLKRANYKIRFVRANKSLPKQLKCTLSPKGEALKH